MKIPGPGPNPTQPLNPVRPPNPTHLVPPHPTFQPHLPTPAPRGLAGERETHTHERWDGEGPREPQPNCNPNTTK